MKVKTSTASRAKSRLVGIFIALATVVIVCVLVAISASETRKTVSVVRLKDDVAANAMITEDMIEEYPMYYKEFAQYGTIEFSDGTKKQSIVSWDDRSHIVGQRYASYFMRGGTVLFWDSTMQEQTKKNSYLYSMDGELLNIKMTTTDDFGGQMVVPGDVLNIRATYDVVSTELPIVGKDDEANLRNQTSDENNSSTSTVTDMLFSEVTVLDMLNSEGDSIFDIYYDFISRSKAEQDTLINSDDFLSSITPSSILIQATAEEADRFAIMSKKSPTYLMTLLPRTSSSSIIDSLSTIQDAIRNKSASAS